MKWKNSDAKDAYYGRKTKNTISDDLISRKALIETLEPFLDTICSEYTKEMVIGKIKYMPAVEEESED